MGDSLFMQERPDLTDSARGAIMGATSAKCTTRPSSGRGVAWNMNEQTDYGRKLSELVGGLVEEDEAPILVAELFLFHSVVNSPLAPASSKACLDIDYSPTFQLPSAGFVLSFQSSLTIDQRT